MVTRVMVFLTGETWILLYRLQTLKFSKPNLLNNILIKIYASPDSTHITLLYKSK
jgi:hypothetical protein